MFRAARTASSVTVRDAPVHLLMMTLIQAGFEICVDTFFHSNGAKFAKKKPLSLREGLICLFLIGRIRKYRQCSGQYAYHR